MTLPALMQASLEYGGSTAQLTQWLTRAAQDYWYWAVGAVVLIVLVWGYLRR